MKYQKARKISFLIFLIGIIFLFVIIALNNNENIQKNPSSVSLFNDGWTVNVKGRIIECADIAEADTGIINDHESIIITKTLNDAGFDNPCITLYTIQAIVNAYIDDELVYTFGQTYYDQRASVPKKYHWFSLGDDYTGKTLRIEITGTRRDCFSGLSQMYIGTIDDLITNAIRNLSIQLVTGLFLFTLGIILIILSPYMFLFHNKDLRILFSGLVSLMLAVFILGFNGIFDLLVGKSFLNTVMEYVALYNLPTFIVGYLMSTYTGRAKKIFTIMFYIDFFLFASSYIMHFTHIARFSNITIVLQLFAGAEFIFTCYVIYKSYASRKKDHFQNIYTAEDIFVFGLILFMVFCFLDIINFNILKYGHGPGEISATLHGFTIGALIFVICLMVSYLFYNIFSSDYDSMQSHIMDLAYTDALTGLSNRARCEQLMEMLSENHGSYAIISLDLNRLKYVNDTLGHHEGDRLLTGFATILSDCFWDANLIGRMGGDEFVVIMIEDRTLNLTKRIHELYTLINDWNNKEHMFKYSASYGYAYSYEVPNGSAKEVYMLADNRMYEMKKEHHENVREEVMVNA
ncbi:GGDEF domain-containing protein [Butyrivibrio sp. YAB3001]|uniref:GGDEF domain-containing protein n=1 Tax=Butyrivibrio sp. YAB3001 TaxID=1520812 RepID=UPI0008F6277B|nr:GGDEF domain-containing protein [Butyrivibrio sp. YAB3001]SFC88708.1 diguanylate cyclase (GGDEF) domain-containing protein [Butyrivibrio sp. YAB3001]